MPLQSSHPSLSFLLRDCRNELLSAWRQRARQIAHARTLDKPSLTDHIPLFLEELAQAFEEDNQAFIADKGKAASPGTHGVQRLYDGFDLTEVVAEYNLLRECILQIAAKYGLSLTQRQLILLNRVIDDAIGTAVQAYAAQQARQTQRQREDYLAFIAHDLRTPLNAIALAAAALQREQENSEKRSGRFPSGMWKILQRNISQLSALVNKILDENSNLDTDSGVRLECRVFDLWPMVEALVQDLAPVTGSGAARVVNAVPDDLMIYADASLLRRVLQNLIANAVTHAPGSTIVVSACTIDASGSVECKVSDNGPGIVKEKLQRIFDKFETDPKAGFGVGLGLTICKTFVEAHAGTITAESVPGEGTVLRFTLPGAGSAAPAGDVIQTPAPSDGTR